MEKLPELGKIHSEFFNRVIFPRLGAVDKSVLVKPCHGVDFGVIQMGNEVVVMSTDPFFIAKELGIERAAWFALHIIASDVAVSGIKPRYLSIDLNLPPGMSEHELEVMWRTVDRECRKLGISVVTGHTARYAGCNYPMVGGATAIGVGKRSELIIPKPKPGNVILVTKGPAVETTGLMAAYFQDFLRDKYGARFVKAAQEIFYQMSTVKDAMVAASVGGVTAMHDATECGVLGGLYEMAVHSGVGMEINLDNVRVPAVIAKTCEFFEIDPWKAISEGTLLATVETHMAGSVIRELKRKGISASAAGYVVSGKEGIHVTSGGRRTELNHPKIDPFWGKFEEYIVRRKEKYG